MAEFVSDSTKLKACPFCGGAAELQIDHGRTTIGVGCTKCTANQPPSWDIASKQWAVDAWNTRAAPPAMDREAVERKFWLIIREPGRLPDRKGPWPMEQTASILREFMAANPKSFIDYLTIGPDGSPDVDHGPEVLQMTDGRSMSVGRKHNTRVREAANDALSTLSADAIRQGEGKYLVWSNEHRAWWGPDERGYTRVIERAGRYDRDKAFSISSKRGGGWQREANPDEIAIPEADAIAQYTGPRPATPASHTSDGGK